LGDVQTVLVTGAGGFVGNHLCRRLTDRGDDVIGVDRRSSAALPATVESVDADLTERPALPAADVIVHLAAHSQVQPLIDDPPLAVENVQTTEHVLAEAARHDAGVVNVSSRDVFGSAVCPDDTTVGPDSPNPYAASKLAGEAFTNAYRNTTGIDAVSVRLTNVYGPGDHNPRVLPTFVRLATAGERLHVFGRGKLVDFVHVTDACRGLLAAVDRLSTVDGESITVGSGRGRRLETLAELVAETVPDCPGWTVDENRTGDVDRFVADLSRARGLLDYEPTRDFEAAVRETVEWYRDNPSAIDD
jgi:UDP-glucose 4-epimerase